MMLKHSTMVTSFYPIHMYSREIIKNVGVYLHINRVLFFKLSFFLEFDLPPYSYTNDRTHITKLYMYKYI